MFEFCKIETTPSSYHLGYVIGPRINAGGRVGKCSHGAELLLGTDSKKIFKIVSELDAFNNERKDLETNLLNKIKSSISDKVSDSVIVLTGNNWHEGIIGIIA